MAKSSQKINKIIEVLVFDTGLVNAPLYQNSLLVAKSGQLRVAFKKYVYL